MSKRIHESAVVEVARAEREKALWTLDLEADRRRFAGDVESTWLACLETRAALAEAQVELQGLEARLARSRALSAESLTPLATLEEDSTACQAQREVVRGQRELLAALRARHARAEARLAEFARSVGVPAQAALPAALTASLRVQEIRLQLAELAATRCVLRAPMAGIVSEVLRRPGEVVAAGVPVAILVDRRAEAIVAYAPEAQQSDITPGQRVRIRRRSGGRAVDSVVLSVGSAVRILPARTDPYAGVPVWGLSVRVRLPDGLAIRPGESFRIQF